jgi:hypothetical protein
MRTCGLNLEAVQVSLYMTHFHSEILNQRSFIEAQYRIYRTDLLADCINHELFGSIPISS